MHCNEMPIEVTDTKQEIMWAKVPRYDQDLVSINADYWRQQLNGRPQS